MVQNMSAATANKGNNDIPPSPSPYCYWLCNRKAELKVTHTLVISYICAKDVMRYTILHTG